VIDVVVDPNVPTFPPWLRPGQQEKVAGALRAGDPAAAQVFEQIERKGIERLRAKG
jgi:hypothetical protein